MTHAPSTHYCNQREALISLDQTLRSCISAHQCFSDEPCPHAQDFQVYGGMQDGDSVAMRPQPTRTVIPYPAE